MRIDFTSALLHTRHHQYFTCTIFFVIVVIMINIVVIVIFCYTLSLWLTDSNSTCYTYASLSIFHQHDIPCYYWTLKEITGESKSTLLSILQYFNLPFAYRILIQISE